MRCMISAGLPLKRPLQATAAGARRRTLSAHGQASGSMKWLLRTVTGLFVLCLVVLGALLYRRETGRPPIDREPGAARRRRSASLPRSPSPGQRRR